MMIPDIFCLRSAEMRFGVVLTGIIVDHSLDDFIPVGLVLGVEVFGQLDDVLVELLDAPVDVRLLGVGDRAEAVRVLHHLGVVPEFRRAFHVLHFVGVVCGLHIFQLLSSLFEHFVLPVLSGEHPLPNNRILDILMDSLIDMPEHFRTGLEQLLMLIITVVIPEPVPAIPLPLLILQPLLLCLPLLLLFGRLCKILAHRTLPDTLILHLLFLLWRFFNWDWRLFEFVLLLSVLDESHTLNGAEGHQPWDADLHGVGVLQQHEFLGQGVGFLDYAQGLGDEVYLVAFQFVPEQAVCDELLLEEHCEVLDEVLVRFQWDLPEVYSCGEERRQPSLHFLESLFQWIDIELFNFCQLFIFENFENDSYIGSVSDGFCVEFVENFYGSLKALAVSIDICLEFEAIDDLLFLCLVFQVVHYQLHVNFQKVNQRLEDLHKLLLIDQLKGLFQVGFHEFEEFSIGLFHICLGLDIGALIEPLQIIQDIIDPLDKHLPQVMLGISLDILVLTEDPIESTIWGFLLLLLPEVNAPDPLMLDPLEGRLDLHHHRHLVEQIPEHLELARKVGVHRRLTDHPQVLDLLVDLLELLVLVRLDPGFEFALDLFRVGLFWGHFCYTYIKDIGIYISTLEHIGQFHLVRGTRLFCSQVLLGGGFGSVGGGLLGLWLQLQVDVVGGLLGLLGALGLWILVAVLLVNQRSQKPQHPIRINGFPQISSLHLFLASQSLGHCIQHMLPKEFQRLVHGNHRLPFGGDRGILPHNRPHPRNGKDKIKFLFSFKVNSLLRTLFDVIVIGFLLDGVEIVVLGFLGRCQGLPDLRGQSEVELLAGNGLLFLALDEEHVGGQRFFGF